MVLGFFICLFPGVRQSMLQFKLPKYSMDLRTGKEVGENVPFILLSRRKYKQI